MKLSAKNHLLLGARSDVLEGFSSRLLQRRILFGRLLDSLQKRRTKGNKIRKWVQPASVSMMSSMNFTDFVCNACCDNPENSGNSFSNWLLVGRSRKKLRKISLLSCARRRYSRERISESFTIYPDKFGGSFFNQKLWCNAYVVRARFCIFPTILRLATGAIRVAWVWWVW